jgi:hypothetical protein
MKMNKNLAALCMAAALGASVASAAENGLFPTNLGPEGMQTFNIPPPGLYALNYTNYFHASQINDHEGNKFKGLNPDINVLSNGFRFVNYYDLARSDTYRFGLLNDVTIPFGYVDSDIGSDSQQQFGLEDIILDPLAFYYKRGTWLNVGFSPTWSTLPTGRWDRDHLVNLGRNYFSYQPTLAYTVILNDKIDISGRLRYIYNFTNNDGARSSINPTGANYQSGEMIAWDFALGYAVTDKLELAVNGYYLRQIADDQIYGNTASNSALQHVFDGGRSNVFGLGPAIGYDLGRLRAYAQWQHQFDAENTAQGDSFWLRLAMPLTFWRAQKE